MKRIARFAFLFLLIVPGCRQPSPFNESLDQTAIAFPSNEGTHGILQIFRRDSKIVFAAARITSTQSEADGLITQDIGMGPYRLDDKPLDIAGLDKPVLFIASDDGIIERPIDAALSDDDLITMLREWDATEGPASQTLSMPPPESTTE